MATIRKKNVSTLPAASLGTGQARADEARPWERLAAESVQAFQAFRTCLDLGDARSLVEAARVLKKRKSYSLIRRWASRYDWKGRAWAWDRAQAREDEAALRQDDHVNRP